MQWIVLHTFLGRLDKTASLNNDNFHFLISSMQPQFEGVCVTSSDTTRMPPAALES